MEKYPRLTLEEHRQFGRELKKFQKKVWEIIVKYPKSSYECLRLCQLEAKISAIRSVMDDAVVKEHRHLSESDLLSVYFPSE